jgi:hypothetical protein
MKVLAKFATACAVVFALGFGALTPARADPISMAVAGTFFASGTLGFLAVETITTVAIGVSPTISSERVLLRSSPSAERITR